MKTGKNISTFMVQVIFGLKIGYSENLLSIEQMKEEIEKAVEKVKEFTFSGTLTQTTIFAVGSRKTFCYEEPAVIISSGIYPRYPVEISVFKKQFTEFIGELATLLKQERVAIQFSDESFMLETDHCTKPDL